jgi:hypothetical protein
LIRASIHLQEMMDCRVKPGNDSINDDTVDNLRERLVLTFTDPVAISTPPGTSGLLALGWDT